MGEEVVILKQLYVYTRIEQINKYIIDNKSWVFHYWRKKLQIGKGDKLNEPWYRTEIRGISLYSGF